jgi:hypothetical protein
LGISYHLNYISTCRVKYQEHSRCRSNAIRASRNFIMLCNVMSTLTKSKIPSAIPPLPTAADTPWPADVIQAHCGLVSAFGTSYRALNLDESDPIRLGHHLKQAETFMTSIVDVFSTQTDNPLPAWYIETIGWAVELLADGLRDALSRATLMFVIPPCMCLLPLTFSKAKGQMYQRLTCLPQRGVGGVADHGRSSLRHFSRRPSSLGGTSVSQNWHLRFRSTRTPSKIICASTRSHDNHSQPSPTHRLIISLDSTSVNTQTPGSVTSVDTFFSRAYGFNVNGSPPPSVVWTILQKLFSVTQSSNDANTNLQDQMHSGTWMVTTSLGHGVL